ncbi:MAG: class I SAM-dependent methyltransferase [Ardenticatenaceae bacterium]|nr:class I SAM-dependent methyltransferase [Ardenticatenaceae bacterium]
MNPEVAQKLLALNREFYGALAQPFAETRETPQPGFDRLRVALPCVPCDVLDVGCGNGRFGYYLQQHDALGHYAGVDFSSELLAHAALRVPGDYFQRDLSRMGSLDGLVQYDVVACLAVLQHIPGFENRLRLLQEMKERLSDSQEGNGRIFLSTWQFMGSERQRRKLRDWAEIGLSAVDVEPNDFLLTWQRDGFGLRYVCLVDEVETVKLAEAAGLRVLDQFRSDGKEGDLNLYTVLRND